MSIVCSGRVKVKMISLSSTEQRTLRHKRFAKGADQAQIYRSLINTQLSDKKDAVYDYWERTGMTSSGAKLK